MQLTKARTGLLYCKEFLQMTLFSGISNSHWIMAFNASPLSLLVKGFLGISLVLLALLQALQFILAANKNLDGLLGALSSLTSSVLSNVSLYSGILGRIFGFTFAAGPWFFVAGISIGLLYQLTMTGLNLYRAFSADPGSAQRMHYVQASLNNGFNILQMCIMLPAVILVMIAPVSPVAAGIFCLLVVVLVAINCTWRLAPVDKKEQLKNTLGLGKPDESNNLVETTPSPSMTSIKVSENHCPGLFSTSDYTANLKKLETHEAMHEYLQVCLEKKLAKIDQGSVNLKNLNKKATLLRLQNVLSGLEVMPSKIKLQNEHPGVFQSFWSDKGEVEQIVEAFAYYCNHVNNRAPNNTQLYANDCSA